MYIYIYISHSENWYKNKFALQKLIAHKVDMRNMVIYAIRRD